MGGPASSSRLGLWPAEAGGLRANGRGEVWATSVAAADGRVAEARGGAAVLDLLLPTLMLLPDTSPNLRPPGELPLHLHAFLLNFLSFYNHVECIRSGEKHALIHANFPCALVVTVCRTILGLLGFGTHACMA
jgi:hypothetical protein